MDEQRVKLLQNLEVAMQRFRETVPTLSEREIAGVITILNTVGAIHYEPPH